MSLKPKKFLLKDFFRIELFNCSFQDILPKSAYLSFSGGLAVNITTASYLCGNH